MVVVLNTTASGMGIRPDEALETDSFGRWKMTI